MGVTDFSSKNVNFIVIDLVGLNATLSMHRS